MTAACQNKLLLIWLHINYFLLTSVQTVSYTHLKVQKIEQGLVRTPLTESERLQRKRENQKRYRERKKEAKMKSNEQEGLVRLMNATTFNL